MTTRKILFPLLTTCALTLPGLAHAAPPDADADADADAGADAGASAEGSVALGANPEASAEVDAAAKPAKQSKSKYSLRKDQKWIKRWAPEPNMVELGVYGGILMLADTHELFGADRNLPEQGYKPLRTLNPDLGLRVGYYPSRFVGIEAEGGVMPSKVRDEAGNALLYTARAHAVLQLGLWSVTPFVLVGAGGLGVSSPRESLGNDIDPALHFGGGVKFFLNRWVMLRLDVRDVVSHQQGVDNTFKSHNLEALLGLSFTLGRKKDKDARGPSDRDGDGFYDDDGTGVSQDTCPADAGVAPDGCPILDTDQDGILDAVDACVNQAETINDFDDLDGCPESDQDGDGFWDDDGHGVSQDTCPADAGVAPDGCPIPDTDGDGILDPTDACIPDPETKNGFEDTDGCPDEVPSALAKFTGAIKGITFDTGKDTIRKTSTPILQDAVKVLAEYPDIRIEVSGHTDNQGDRDFNVDLSRRRAESVKNYLTGKGIDPSRIETVGHGPDKPVDTNDTKTGRGKNRRIEFKILTAS